MTRRPRGVRRPGPPAVAALLLGLSATAAAAAMRFPPPVLRDSVRLAQGMKAPDGASEDADAAPPPALPRGATLGTARTDTNSAALAFPVAPMSFPATPRGKAAPGPAPAVGAPPGVRPGTGPGGASDRKGQVETDAGPPAALPPGARFVAAPLAFTSAEMHFVAASVQFAAPGVAALPGGMAMREEGRGLRVTLDADVLFDFDRAELRAEAGPQLQRLMQEVSARVPRPAFRVEGHTDWIGGDAYNLRLSTRRAESVRNWLVREGGVPRPAVSTAGYGESRPVAPNSAPDGRDDPDGRQRNRRVELLVTPR
ncbi:MAG: Outer membrane protein A precursor [uncultured Acetobacteraceae bacterium]|uniref:Outer membrane protein A n=1 Tax=uncultured Acetobacteraceae bacterium TaxID=169975 RepID=A0A6J4I1V3_9PROT|nr:MAG: Outer membrane protein A precursor [uncultured Acetobacteraceae bacterium]